MCSVWVLIYLGVCKREEEIGKGRTQERLSMDKVTMCGIHLFFAINFQLLHKFGVIRMCKLRKEESVGFAFCSLPFIFLCSRFITLDEVLAS